MVLVDSTAVAASNSTEVTPADLGLDPLVSYRLKKVVGYNHTRPDRHSILFYPKGSLSIVVCVNKDMEYNDHHLEWKPDILFETRFIDKFTLSSKNSAIGDTFRWYLYFEKVK